MVMLLGVRLVNTKPKLRAADTSAFSSGDCAWYSSLPANEGEECGSNPGALLSVLKP
jgi:hypothetical protein